MKTLLLIAAGGLALTLASCSMGQPQLAKQVVGKWKLVEEDGSAIPSPKTESRLLQLHADGTRESETVASGHIVKSRGKHRVVDENTLVFETEEFGTTKETTAKVTLNGDRLSLQWPKWTSVYQRVP